jgi:hypothetical protein
MQIYRGNNYSVSIFKDYSLWKNSLHKEIIVFSNVRVSVFVFGGVCLHYTVKCLLKTRALEPEKQPLLGKAV